MRVFPEFALTAVNSIFAELLLNKFFCIGIIGINIISRYYQLRIIFFGKVIHILKHCGLGPVVGVHKIHIFTLRLINSGIAGTRSPAVFLMNNDNTRVFFGVFIADFAASVLSSVVNAEKLPIGKGLCLNAFYRLSDIILNTVDGHYDANLNFSHYLPNSLSVSSKAEAITLSIS